jgi:hypothetical protein
MILQRFIGAGGYVELTGDSKCMFLGVWLFGGTPRSKGLVVDSAHYSGPVGQGYVRESCSWSAMRGMQSVDLQRQMHHRQLTALGHLARTHQGIGWPASVHAQGRRIELRAWTDDGSDGMNPDTTTAAIIE